MSNKGYGILGVLRVAVLIRLTAGAYAQDDAFGGVPEPIPPGTPHGGVIGKSTPSAAGDVEVIYDSAPQITPQYFNRTLIGWLDADDIRTTLGPGGGIMVSYTLDVFGSTTIVGPSSDCPAEAAVPYTVTTALWTDTADPPDPGLAGVPLAPIPGTACTFVDVPKGPIFTLSCPIYAPIPGAFWLMVQFDSDCAGWIAAGAGDPEVGFSHCGFLFSTDDGGTTWTILDSFCAGVFLTMVSTMRGFDPGIWSCCDTSDHSCVNVGAGGCLDVNQIFTPGVLCNDLDPPCSAAGACCDIATGQCEALFEVDCGGFLEQFTQGATCQNVDCQTPNNVPAVTHWGMMVLTLLLLTALTIKFGRSSSVGDSFLV